MTRCSSTSDQAAFVPRDHCFACRRPAADCFCAVIPRIDNRTDILILQHRRERRHPFNSARIVERALRRSRVIVGYSQELAELQLPFGPGTGLLYPGPNARLLAELPAEARPSQLVLLDGTWHHAKTLFRDIRSLHDLPQYRIEAPMPGRYRIRREPDLSSYSTLEATRLALQVLEPATPGLDRLMAAFDHMVQRQLAHPNFKRNWRSQSRRGRPTSRLPTTVQNQLRHVVVAYGEAGPRFDAERSAKLPVYWVAERIGTGERFVNVIRPERALCDTFLEHLQLSRSAFEQAISTEQFCRNWNAFLRPTDTIAVYNRGTLALLSSAQAACEPALVLKSVCADLDRRTYCDLAALLDAKRLRAGPSRFSGRAGKRLANSVTLVEYLRGWPVGR